MNAFDDSHDKIPEFQVFRQYIRMFIDTMLFVSAVRTGNWPLHMTALKLRKNDLLVTCGMAVMPKSDPEFYKEFRSEN